MKMFYRVPSLVGLVVIFGIVLVNAVVMSAREPLSAEINVFNTTPYSSVVSAKTNRPVMGELTYWPKGQEDQKKVIKIAWLNDAIEFTLDDLTPNNEYTYEGFLQDAFGNRFIILVSAFKTMGAEDQANILPGVTEFIVQGEPKSKEIEITLSWLPPGEEVPGGFYEIRYASWSLLVGAQNVFDPAFQPFQNDEEFLKGIEVKGAPKLALGDKSQNFTFNLPYNVPAGPFNLWYFAMRVSDGKGNYSALSPVLWASSLAPSKVKEADKPPALVKKITPALLPLLNNYLKQAKAFFDVPGNVSFVASTLGPKGEVWLAQNKILGGEDRPKRPTKEAPEQNGFGLVFKSLTNEWPEVYIDKDGKVIMARYDADKKFIEFLKK